LESGALSVEIKNSTRVIFVLFFILRNI
jgi:hypothetical protein